jgi:hypothetical protein
MKQLTLAAVGLFERYAKTTAAGGVSYRDGAGRAVAGAAR